jgi:zinc transport system permease protein
MLDLFSYSFVLRSLAAGLVIATVAPLIGNFLVVRRYSLIADTLAHLSLVGVAIGFLFKNQSIWVVLLTAIAAGLLMEHLRSDKKIYGESVLALFLSGGLAVSVVIISYLKNLNSNFYSYLFGSINTVSDQDLIIIFLLGCLTATIIFLFYRQLYVISLDEDLALAQGIKTKFLNQILIVLASIIVALSLKIVGSLLISALMVVPVLTAMQFSRSFKQTIILSIIFSLLAVVSGFICSYYFDLATGGIIVIMAIIFFGVAYWFTH